MNPDNFVYLRMFLLERFEENCGRELDFTVARYWAGRRNVNSVMSHTEKRMMQRAAYSIAQKFAETHLFKNYLEDVSQQARQILETSQRTQQISKPVDETALFLSQSWSRPLDGTTRIDFDRFADEEATLEDRKWALSSLLGLPGSHFLEETSLNPFIHSLFQALPLLSDEIFPMFTKLLKCEEEEVQHITFESLAKFAFGTEVLNLSEEINLKFVDFYGQLLLSMPDQWRRESPDLIAKMIVSFFQQFKMDHKILNSLNKLDAWPKFFILWWSILDIRLKIQPYAGELIKEFLRKLNEEEKNNEIYLELLTIIYVYRCSNGLQKEIRHHLLRSLPPQLFALMAENLARHGQFCTKLFAHCDDKEFFGIFEKILENLVYIPKALMKLVEKRLKSAKDPADFAKKIRDLQEKFPNFQLKLILDELDIKDE